MDIKMAEMGLHALLVQSTKILKIHMSSMRDQQINLLLMSIIDIKMKLFMNLNKHLSGTIVEIT